jgi:hypothetical protein
MGEVFASAPFIVGRSEPSPTDAHIPAEEALLARYAADIRELVPGATLAELNQWLAPRGWSHSTGVIHQGHQDFTNLAQIALSVHVTLL